MTTSYPGAYDAFAAPGANLSDTPNHDDMHIDVQDAVEAIEAELGLNPSGSAATVAARLNAIDATTYSAWTPTVTQSGSVTVTTTDAKKLKVGRKLDFEAYLIVTGSGTGANDIVISLPEATAARYTVNHVLGVGFIYDTSTTFKYKAIVAWASATTVKLHPASGTADGYLGSNTMTAGLAAGDLISIHGNFETLT